MKLIVLVVINILKKYNRVQDILEYVIFGEVKYDFVKLDCDIKYVFFWEGYG